MADYINSFVMMIIWTYTHHWFHVVLFEWIVETIGFVLMFFTVISPRWFFQKNDLTNCFKSLRRILKMNRKPVRGVKEMLERHWRYTRTLPKPNENVLGFFRYPLLKKTLFICLYIRLIFNPLWNVLDFEAPMFSDYGLQIIEVSSLLIWFLVTRWYDSNYLLLGLLACTTCGVIITTANHHSVFGTFLIVATTLPIAGQNTTYLYGVTPMNSYTLVIPCFICARFLSYGISEALISMLRVVLVRHLLFVPLFVWAVALVPLLINFDTFPSFRSVREAENYLKQEYLRQ